MSWTPVDFEEWRAQQMHEVVLPRRPEYEPRPCWEGWLMRAAPILAVLAIILAIV